MDHQERRQDQRRARHQHHLHDHGHQQRPQHVTGATVSDVLPAGHDVRLGHERRHLRRRHEHGQLHDRHIWPPAARELHAHPGRGPGLHRHAGQHAPRSRPPAGVTDPTAPTTARPTPTRSPSTPTCPSPRATAWPRGAGDEDHLHDHGHQQRPQRRDRRHGQRRAAGRPDVHLGSAGVTYDAGTSTVSYTTGTPGQRRHRELHDHRGRGRRPDRHADQHRHGDAARRHHRPRPGNDNSHRHRHARRPQADLSITKTDGEDHASCRGRTRPTRSR